MTTIMAIVVMLIARHMGLSTNTIKRAAVIMMDGMTLKTMVLYSFIDFSVQKEIDCSYLDVDISVPYLLPCSTKSSMFFTWLETEGTGYDYKMGF